MTVSDHFEAIQEELLALSPSERRRLLDFDFHDMFAWWDEKPYAEAAPMILNGQPVGHAEARYIWLALLDMKSSGVVDFGPDLEDV